MNKEFFRNLFDEMVPYFEMLDNPSPHTPNEWYEFKIGFDCEVFFSPRYVNNNVSVRLFFKNQVLYTLACHKVT